MVKESTVKGKQCHATFIVAPECNEDPPSLAPPDPRPPATPPEKGNDLIYQVEDVPPWYLALFFGLQHYFTVALGAVSIPIIVSSYLCLAEDDPIRGALVCTVLFHSGVVTVLQTTFGVRLPIVQATDIAYMIPTIILLTTVHTPCSSLPLSNMTDAERDQEWRGRIQEVQGAIAVVSVFEIVLGFTGLIGVLIRWVTPLAIAPTISLVGLSLFDVAATKASTHWGVTCMTTALMILFSQYLSRVEVPVPFLPWRGRGGAPITISRIFKCFPILSAILVSWGLCAILTVCEVFPSGSPARTDTSGAIMRSAPMFFFPYPLQWGWPKVTMTGVVAMVGASVASMTESIGDYLTCARMSGVPPPPRSAINRGIGVEGLGCLLAGLLGTGSGTTSCSANVGVISVTKVSSRRVVQISGVILIVSGLVGKLGAAFVSIPEPVVAGIFMVMFSMVAAVGLSSLQNVDLGSSRNIFILGISLFLGLLIPKWLEQHPDRLQTGSVMLDQILLVLLQTPMVVGGVTGGVLDNTIPGTARERGLEHNNHHHQKGHHGSNNSPRHTCYDLPWITKYIRRVSWARYLPFSPTFDDSPPGECKVAPALAAPAPAPAQAPGQAGGGGGGRRGQ